MQEAADCAESQQQGMVSEDHVRLDSIVKPLTVLSPVDITAMEFSKKLQLSGTAQGSAVTEATAEAHAAGSSPSKAPGKAAAAAATAAAGGQTRCPSSSANASRAEAVAAGSTALRAPCSHSLQGCQEQGRGSQRARALALLHS